MNDAPLDSLADSHPSPVASIVSTQTLAGWRVLIVEDEYFIADDLARAFRRAGAVIVGPAPSLSKATAAIALNTIDFAVLDIKLGNDLVFLFADHLLERRIPFVFATGYDGSVIPRRFAAVPSFQKPVRTVQLVEAIMPMKA
ncbi:response regulator [Sphingomonas sp. Xoc002]|uniref:response regulator n=1 Tax=Sphingomonas sp. Xoc002 TaxID=2837624 RepID=UPI003D185D47